MVELQTAEDFDVFQFASLIQSLRDAKSNPTHEGLQQLDADLEEALPWLEGLLEFPGKSENVRTRMKNQAEEYGPGRLNAIFVLSDFLSLSETICESLMAVGAEFSSRYGRSPTETASILFSEFRRDLLACITFFWETTAPPRPYLPPLPAVDGDFAELMEKYREKLESRWKTIGAGYSTTAMLLDSVDVLQVSVNDFTLPNGKFSAETERVQRAQFQEASSNARHANTAAPMEPCYYPDDMKTYRTKALRAEQRTLAKLVYLKASREEMIRVEGHEDIVKLLFWMKTRTRLDELTKMVYAAWIVTLMPIIANSDGTTSLRSADQTQASTLRHDLMASLQEDQRLMTICQGELVAHDEWKSLELQRIAILEWAIFLEVMDRSRLRPKDRRFTNKDGPYSRANVEQFVLSVIRSGAFSHFRTFLQTFPVAEDRSEELAFSPPVTWPAEEREYSQIIMSSALRAITAFLQTFQAIKRLKTNEEDQRNVALRNNVSDTNLRNDTKDFFELTVDLYSRVTDGEAHHGWAEQKLRDLVAEYIATAGPTDGSTPKDGDILPRLLKAISRTPTSVHFLFNYLRNDKGPQGSLNFDQIHRALAAIAGKRTSLSARQSDRSTSAPAFQIRAANQQSPLPSAIPSAESIKGEDDCLAAYCRLLTELINRERLVAKELIAVRFAENHEGGFLRDLLTLLNRELPALQRAAVLDSLTAFGYALGEVEDYRAARMILFELSDLGLTTGSGSWLHSLIQADASGKGSLAVAALVKLFTCVLQFQERAVAASLRDGEVYKPTMRSGITAAMVDFVMDDVLALTRGMKADATSDAYANALDAVLQFVDRNLLSFDLEMLEDAFTPGKAAPGRTAVSMLTNAIEQPGADILQRTLSDQRTFESITDPALVGREALVKNGSLLETSLAAQGVRVIYRVLKKQTLFIQMLRPLLDQHKAHFNLHRFRPRNFYPLDRHLEAKPESVAAVASYLAIDMRADLALFSIKILATLGDSPSFVTSTLIHGIPQLTSRLASIICNSSESAVIMSGFVGRLAATSEKPLDQRTEQPQLSLVVDGFTNHTALLQNVLSGATTENAVFDIATWLIRSAILDLLLAETRHDKPGPTLAHFLLGLTVDGQQFVQNISSPHELGAMQTCFHLVLDQLLDGIPRTDDPESESSGRAPITEVDPYIAEKTMRLVYQLASHDVVSTVVTRYLRNQEDFIHRNLRCLRTVAPYRSGPLAGIAQYGDGTSVETTNADLTATLAFQSLVVDLSALELHLLNAGSPDSVNVVKSFLESSSHVMDSEENGREGYLEQTSPLCLELLAHLDIEWQDLVNKGNISPQYFNNIDFESYRASNESGILLYDIEGLRNEMDRQVGLSAKTHPQLSEEIRNKISIERRDILEYLAKENDKRLAEGAAVECLQSWMKLLEVILFKGFGATPAETQQSTLFDLLRNCFVYLTPSGHLSEGRASLLSQTVFSLTTVLREQISATSSSMESVPIDQLSELLSQLLGAISDNGSNELGRGHLYASLLNFMQIVRSAERESRSSTGLASSDKQPGTQNGSTLAVATISQIDAHLERMLEVVCRDATSGSEVWQAASYSVLEAIVGETTEKQSEKLVGYLNRAGYMQSFVRGLERSDAAMRQVLQEEPDGLDSLFALQARLSLLQRLAQSRLGSQLLIEAGLFQVLGRCSFVDARPSRNGSTLDSESAYSAALERYYDLLRPVLDLVELVVAQANASNCKKAYNLFIGSHRDTFLGFLWERPSTISIASITALQQLSTILSLVESVADRSSLHEFAAFDSALKALGSRFFDTLTWGDLLTPLSADEQRDNRIISPNDSTVFMNNGAFVVKSLLKTLLAYYVGEGVSAVVTGFHPMLAAGPVVGRNGAPNNTSLPTIAQAVSLVHHRLEDLLDSLGEYGDLAFKLNQGDGISSSEVDELLDQQMPSTIKRLGFAQKMEIASRILRRSVLNAQQQVFEDLDSVELLLILLQRHIYYYSNQPSNQMTDSRNLQYISTNTSSAVPAYVKEANESLDQMQPLLGQLDRLELSNIGGEEGKSREILMKLLVKRLLDIGVTTE